MTATNLGSRPPRISTPPIPLHERSTAVTAHHQLLAETLEPLREVRRKFLEVGDDSWKAPVDPRVDIAFAMVDTALRYMNGMASDFKFNTTTDPQGD